MSVELNGGKLPGMFAPIRARVGLSWLVSQVEDDRRPHGV